MSAVVIDTNVLVTANGSALPAGVTPKCIAGCAVRLRDVRDSERVVLDSGWSILGQYKRNVNERGQPGPGDAFLKWLLTNLKNPARCTLVQVVEVGDTYAEFPDDDALAGFDRSDHVFVAVTVADAEHPPILNATDSDWANYHEALVAHNIRVEYLCPNYLYPKTTG